MNDQTKALLYGGLSIAALSTLILLSKPTQDPPKLGRVNSATLWRITHSPRSRREIASLNAPLQQQVTAALVQLERDPLSHEPLSEPNSFRLRIDSHIQILYTLDPTDHRIFVVSVSVAP